MINKLLIILITLGLIGNIGVFITDRIYFKDLKLESPSVSSIVYNTFLWCLFCIIIRIIILLEVGL